MRKVRASFDAPVATSDNIMSLKFQSRVSSVICRRTAARFDVALNAALILSKMFYPTRSRGIYLCFHNVPLN